ncbi:hypothetical protein RJ640_008177 [Escallonia rubra]|uniref:Uncharacterized protein n=1 Tax=Escallonia rubra TaxID=112253 RepID=A0AA88RC63_9ASTE|nr:hypothetical protein RJ640_008177 [Escallonia rubra]
MAATSLRIYFDALMARFNAVPALIERAEARILSARINFPGKTLNHAIKAAKEIIKDVLNIIKQRKTDLLDKDSASIQHILSLGFLTADENGS